jgi:hypothetical protein
MGRNVRTRASSLALAVFSAVVVLLPSQTAHAATPAAKDPFVEIVSPDGLYADGAGVVLFVKTKCPAAAVARVELRMSQISDQGFVVTGDGTTEFTCTGKAQRASVPMYTYERFRPAEAFASAQMYTCDDFGCHVLDGAARTVQLREGLIERPRYDGDSLTFRLPNSGTLEAAGAGATIFVPYTCGTGMLGRLDGYLAQRGQQGFFTSANASIDLECTATKRTGVLAFHAQGLGWRKGDAFLAVTSPRCDEFACRDTATTYRTVRLK